MKAQSCFYPLEKKCDPSSSQLAVPNYQSFHQVCCVHQALSGFIQLLHSWLWGGGTSRAGHSRPPALSGQECPDSLDCSTSHIGMYWFLLCALGFPSQPGEVTLEI